jgi:hypothetical protein
MVYGPKVRMFWTATDTSGAVTYSSAVVEPEDAATLARELSDAAMGAAKWRPGRLLALSTTSDGHTTRTYVEDV